MSSKGFGKDQEQKNRKTHKVVKAVEDSAELIHIAEKYQQLMQENWIKNANQIR